MWGMGSAEGTREGEEFVGTAKEVSVCYNVFRMCFRVERGPLDLGIHGLYQRTLQTHHARFQTHFDGVDKNEVDQISIL